MEQQPEGQPYNRPEFHPAAEIFNLMDEPELKALAHDIEEHGQRDPIIVDEQDRIIDGRNRWLACQRARVSPRTCQYSDEQFKAQGGVLAFIVSRNLHRRHLDESQRAMAAAKFANLKRGQTKASREGSIELSNAATRFKVSVSSVKRAREIEQGGTPELQRAVTAGAIKVSTAALLTDLPDEQQDRLAQDPKQARRVAAQERAKKRAPARALKVKPGVAASPEAADASEPGPLPAPDQSEGGDCAYPEVVAAIVQVIVKVPRSEWNEIWDRALAAAAKLKAAGKAEGSDTALGHYVADFDDQLDAERVSPDSGCLA